MADNGDSFVRRIRDGLTGWNAAEEIWADGLLQALGAGTWLLAYSDFFKIDEDIRSLVGLPAPESVRIALESRGVPTSARFRIRADVRHPERGRLAEAERAGPAYVLAEDDCVVVNEQVWQLIEAVEAPPGDAAGLPDRLRYLARCRDLGMRANAQLDAFLEREEILECPELGVDAEEEDGGDVLLSPIAGELGSDDLVLPNGRARQVVNQRGKDGIPRRYVLPDDTREKIEYLAEHARVSGADVPRLLTNPESLLPEGIDLSRFSERVSGFRTRVYNSRPYVHVREGSRGWFEVDWGVKAESATPALQGGDPADTPQSIPPEEYSRLVQKACETGERFVKHGQDWIEIDTEEGRRFGEMTGRLSASRRPDGQFPRNVVLEVIPNVDVLGFEVRIPPELLPAETRGRLPPFPDRSVPKGLQAKLHPHQMLGYRWLGYLHERGGGGLLADEMGVGKTLQVIAHFLELAEREELSPSLLVLPKTLIQNWLEEISRFAPSLRKLIVHDGPSRPRDPDLLAEADLVLTTYDTVRRDQFLLGTVDWHVVVCDEAQFVKNPTAGRTAAVKAMKARQPLALTGTPVENGLIEFWCIVDYVQPGRLSSWSEFRTEFERPLAAAVGDQQRSELVEALLARLVPHYLRRLKDEVLADLPPKGIEEMPLTEPSNLQRRLYVETIEQARADGRGAMLAALGRLLRICAHPRSEMGGFEVASSTALLAESPKLAQTIEVLRRIRDAGEKALVFAEWKSIQRILQTAIHAELGFRPPILNGEVTSNRMELVRSFCAAPGFGVLVLSPHVAGYGLNIVEANHVIHYTRPWNPAKENQATDRVHRIGQTRPVRLYYPTVAGTAEERLAELLADKQALARDVLRPSSERMVQAEELLKGVYGSDPTAGQETDDASYAGS